MIRFYFALTNLCNRSCELCSCHSDPQHNTSLSLADFKKRLLDCNEPYEVQLEGGEPLIHKDFYKMVEFVCSQEKCIKIVLCTNTVLLPWKYLDNKLDVANSISSLVLWLKKFSTKSFLIKPSINSHLINNDKPGLHLEKMTVLNKAVNAHNTTLVQSSNLGDIQKIELTYNVRRIPGIDNDELYIKEALIELGLYNLCNDFYYQQYGKAKNELNLEAPFIIKNPVKFHLISPDNKDFGTDLVARADHMEGLK